MTSLWQRAARTIRHDTWVRPFLLRYRRVLVASLVLGVLALVFGALLMFASGYLISSAAEQPALGLYSLLVPLGLVQLFGVARPFLGYLERLTSHDWVLRMTSQLRLSLYRSIEGQGMFWQATHRAGDVLGLLASDIGHVQNLYLRTVFPFAIAWAVWLLAVALFGTFDPLFGAGMLLELGLFTLVMPLVSVLANGARVMRVKELETRLYAQTYDDVVGLGDWVLARRKADFVRRVMDNDARMSEELARQATFEHLRAFASQVLFGLTAVIVLAWAASCFATTEPAFAGIPDRATEWVAAFLLGLFPLSEAFAVLPDAATQSVTHLGAIERMNAMPPARTRSSECEAASDEELRQAMANPTIMLEHVGLSFEQPILRDVNLTIEPGQRLAMLGPSGSGKTTLLSLIRGDRTPTSGSVTIGGLPTARLGEHAPACFGYIHQETYLFNLTLFENVTIAKPKATREEATAALRAVGLGPLLAHLPDGLDTLVDEAGLRFSGGERHRIALARVLLQDAPVVILDEPFVSLDPPTELALMDTLLTVLSGKTIIMVTHHLAGIDAFDQVIFLERGDITLHGSPAELATHGERYRQLRALER